MIANYSPYLTVTTKVAKNMSSHSLSILSDHMRASYTEML